jgi:hypothetical protein
VKQQTLDALRRSLFSMPSRRHLLHGLAGAGLGLGISRFPAGVEGKKRKRKRKKRKPNAKPNAYGCLEVGDACKNADQCCSGICAGKQGKKKCRAHGTGTCNQELPGLCSNIPTVAPCNVSASCFCITTTANSSFCAQLGQSLCSDCKKDTDCEALGLPPGSACLPTTGILCATDCPETGMVCLPPCGTEIPEP